MEWESRLNRVRVATHDGDFDLHWEEREELLALLRGTPDAKGAIDRFMAVRATRPVELTDEQKVIVVSAVEAAWGASEALHELRYVISEELDVAAA